MTAHFSRNGGYKAIMLDRDTIWSKWWESIPSDPNYSSTVAEIDTNGVEIGQDSLFYNGRWHAIEGDTVISYFKTCYTFKQDTVRYDMLVYRDKSGIVHADSGYQIRAGMVNYHVIEPDNRAKWLFLYDGTLIQEKDVIIWYRRQK